MSDLIAGEVLKLRTLRITYLIPLGVLVLVTLVTLADAAFDPVEHNSQLSGFLDTSLTVAAVAAAAYGAAMVSNDFARRSITFDYLASPPRQPVLRAKLVTYAVVGALLALLASGLAHGVASPIAAARDVPADSITDVIVRMALVTAAGALLGAIGASVGFLARTPVVAVSAVVAWQPVETLLGGSLGIGAFLPYGLTSAIVQLGTDDIAAPLALGLLGAYAFAFATVAQARLGQDLA